MNRELPVSDLPGGYENDQIVEYASLCKKQ